MKHLKLDLHQVLDHAPDLLLVSDADGTVHHANLRLKDLFGWQPEALVGQSVDLLLPQRLRDQRHELRRSLLEGGSPAWIGMEHEHQALHLDGHEFPVAVSLTPWFGSGTPLLISTVRDATQRMLRSSGLLQVLEAATNEVYVFDAKSLTFLDVNRSARENLGYSMAEFERMTPLDIKPAFTAAQFDALLSPLRAERGRNASFETLHQRKDRTCYSALVNLQSTAMAGRDVFLAIISDVTEQRRTEQDLREADRKKNEFLATLAHELRNPLAPIRSGLELLRLEHIPSEMHSATTVLIERQVNHMVRLVDDLLDLSRISRGKIELKTAPVDLCALFEEAGADARLRCDAKGLTLQCSSWPTPLVVEADHVRIAQVIGNLVDNAVKFTGAGGTVWLSLIADNNGLAMVRVRDSGLGIEPASAGRLFAMFEQLPNPGRTQQGLGIGLALSRTLVELHSGHITFSSEGLGRGSEFVVSLPLSNKLLPPSPLHAQSQRRLQPRKLRVLVVDDNHDVADSLSALLDMDGHDARTAYDGQHALSLFDDFGPDVAVLDIGLPGMDGHELAQRLRASPEGGVVRMVALSGWGADDDRARSRSAGFDAHLLKPIEFDELGQLLKGWFPDPD